MTGPSGSPGPAPGRQLSAAERAARAVFWIALYAWLAYVFLKDYQLAETDAPISPRRIDFIAFWGAARLALAGEALAAFDPAALSAAAGLPPGELANLLWLYPPGFLILLAPLGALPFWAAWSVFVLVSPVCLALALRGPAAPLPGGWRLVVVAPAVLIGGLVTGQNSVLWTAALVAGLWALRRGQTVTAGLLFALLTLKPQLALLVPLALAASREWRALGWGCLGAAVLALAATLPFGTDYWRLFLAGLAEATARVEQDVMPVERMASVYGFARALGAGHAAALWVQLPASAAVALATLWIWRRPGIGADLRSAALCAAIPLVTPYCFFYEMVITVAAGLFLVRAGFGTGGWARLWLAVLWLGPAPWLYLQHLASLALVTPTILMITMAICLRLAWQAAESRDAGR